MLHIRLRKHFPSLIGVRVCELHRSHGVHFHALFSERVPVDRIRELMVGSGRVHGRNRCLDFGRLSVDKCDIKTALYLSKYMSKNYVRTHWFGRRRRWGTVGGCREGWRATRCKDMVYETAFHRSMRKVAYGIKIPFGLVVLVSHYAAVWGDYRYWPGDIRRAVKVLVLEKTLESGAAVFRR